MPEQRDRSHRPIGEELKQMRAERAQQEAAEKTARKEALQIVERWNHALADGHGELWSLTIRAAILAGMPWLDAYCPGCRTGRALDIRTLDRHPLASVGSLVLGLRCSWCRGSAPMPALMGLHSVPPAAKRGDTSSA